jgi:hypothetical protein
MIECFCQRFNSEADVSFRLFCSCIPNDAIHGIMSNFSRHGCHIETSREFGLGSILLLRVVSYPPAASLLSAEERPHSICLAEVTWLKELNSESEIRYSMKVRYLD